MSTLLTDSNCFVDTFRSHQSSPTDFQTSECVSYDLDSGHCSKYSDVSNYVEYPQTFLYSYMCTSALIRIYIPMYIVVFTGIAALSVFQRILGRILWRPNTAIKMEETITDVGLWIWIRRRLYWGVGKICSLIVCHEILWYSFWYMMMVMMSILTHSLLPALSIHILLTFHLLLHLLHLLHLLFRLYDTLQVPKLLHDHQERYFFQHKHRKMSNIDVYIANLLSYLAILLTFGVLSPALAVVIAMAIVADTYTYQLNVGRFLHEECTIYVSYRKQVCHSLSFSLLLLSYNDAL